MIDRLQAYLRHSAARQYDAVPLPPYTAFFHRHDPFPAFSYAIPDQAMLEEALDPLDQLRELFLARGRQPRLEFIEAFAPQLPDILRRAGFVEESRHLLMVCTPETHRPTDEAPNAVVLEIDASSGGELIRQFMNTQRRGFDPGTSQEATLQEAEHFRTTLHGGLALLAVVDGRPSAAALYTAPHDGIAELAGIATLEPFRRRGLAAHLTDLALRRAFANGVEIACLSAADERAGRIYQRVGLEPVATVLAYRHGQ